MVSHNQLDDFVVLVHLLFRARVICLFADSPHVHVNGAENPVQLQS